MEYQIIYSGQDTYPSDKTLLIALKNKDHGGGHSRIKGYDELKKDTNIIFLGKFNDDILSKLLPNIKRLENTAGHLFFPNQRITDAEAIAIAEHSGKKVIFTPPDTRAKFGSTSDGFAFTIFKDNKSVPFRCARPNTSVVVVPYKNVHEIPDRKNGLSKTDHSYVEWGQFVDTSLDEINAGATPFESPEATQEPQTKKARIGM